MYNESEKLSYCLKCSIKGEYLIKINHTIQDDKYSLLCLPCFINVLNPFEQNDIIYSIININSSNSNNYFNISRVFDIDDKYLIKLKTELCMGVYIYYIQENKIQNYLDNKYIYTWPFNLFLNNTKLCLSDSKNYSDITSLIKNKNIFNVSYSQTCTNPAYLIILSNFKIKINQISYSLHFIIILIFHLLILKIHLIIWLKKD